MHTATISPIDCDEGQREIIDGGMQGSGEEDLEDRGEAGVRVPRRAQDPRMPTEDERRQHELTHLPYRSWGRHCVRGCGQAEPHRVGKRDADAIPELHVDYCFMGKRTEDTQPILVARDRETRASDPYVIRRLMTFIKEI